MRIMWICLVILLNLGASFAEATSSTCPTNCKTKKPIHLHLFSKDIAESWTSFNICFGALNYWNGPHFSSSKLEYHEGVIADVSDVRKIIEEKAAQCLEVKELRICAHGTPGDMKLDKPGRSIFAPVLEAGTMAQHLRGLDCAMSEKADINLVSCKLGDKCEGQEFMAVLGSLLLKKGGTVRADRFSTLSTRISIVTDVKLKPITAVVSRENAPVRFHDRSGNRIETVRCEDQLESQLSKVKSLIEYRQKTCSAGAPLGKRTDFVYNKCKDMLEKAKARMAASEHAKARDRLFSSGRLGNEEVTVFAETSSELKDASSYCGITLVLGPLLDWCEVEKSSPKKSVQ